MRFLLQSNETLDTLLCRPDLERLQRLQFDNDPDKPRRQSASTIDEFFEWPRPPPGPRLAAPVPAPGACSTAPLCDEDVFLRPPALWEDITSSIQKLDPDNADMLGLAGLSGSLAGPLSSSLSSLSAIKMEVGEDPTLLAELAVHQVPQVQPPAPQQLAAAAPAPGPHLQQPLHPHQLLHRPHPMQQHPLQRLPFPPPPTPPASDPGSPSNSAPRRTPPPPYPTSTGPAPASLPLPPPPPPSAGSRPRGAPGRGAAGAGTGRQPGPGRPPVAPGAAPATPKYNRRNNPELEKRRVHHCDFPGCTKVYTKSSHLKAHQRIHT
ncbi:Dendritic arbor reduction protein 1, partial [Frankliniella fusca]